ncbi:MAG: hypothetical protein V3V18_07465 [Methylococcales bacterium]
MSQLHRDNDSSRGKVTIKILLSLTLIGLIIVGFTTSTDKIPIIDKAFATEQAQKNQADIKKRPPITGTRG